MKNIILLIKICITILKAGKDYFELYKWYKNNHKDIKEFFSDLKDRIEYVLNNEQ